MVNGPAAHLATRSVIDEEQRRASLRRMKVVATGLVVLAAIGYAATAAWLSAGAPEWVGYVNAAAAAGLIGGIADWFAVTALFRHPLGLPIAHTAIIPRKKDQLGENLSTFVAVNFLAEAVVREKVARTDVARLVGDWLAVPENASRVSDEIAAGIRGSLNVLSDDDVRNALEFAVMRRLATLDAAPPLGRLLGQLVADGAHHGLVDVIVNRTWVWLATNRDVVMDTIGSHAPTWSPAFVDDIVSERIYAEIMRVATEVRDDPNHETRATVDQLLADLAMDLQRDPETKARVQRAKDGLLTHPEARILLDQVWSSGRATLIDLATDPESGLRTGITEQLQGLGERLVSDPRLAENVNAWAADVAAHVAREYSESITSIISDTVSAWDATETTERVELHVGRDLQFVRVNGFVVGALVGVAIHALTELAL